MTPQEQAHVFGMMLCCGACLGVVYDLLGLLRCIAGLCGASDLLFGAIAAAGIVAACLAMQTEPFRLYVFAGAGLGLALYGMTIGLAIRQLARCLNRQKSGEKCKKRESLAGN